MNETPRIDSDARQAAAVLARHPEIELAYVFGSIARGVARFDSDIDIAVAASRPLEGEARMRLMEEFAVATGRAVDLIDLRNVGEPLLGQILKHGLRLVGSTHAHAALMRRHVFDMEDFMPYVERMLAERRNAWTN